MRNVTPSDAESGRNEAKIENFHRFAADEITAGFGAVERLRVEDRIVTNAFRISLQRFAISR